MQTNPTPETPDQRTGRLAEYFRELAELNMASARSAARRIAANDAADQDTRKPSLDLAAATRAVVAIAHVETALFRKQAPPRAAADDARRAPLRKALHIAAAATADPAASRRDADTAIEETLVADPDAETPLSKHFIALVGRLQFHIDPATVPDELLGLEPLTEPEPTSNRPYPDSDDPDTGDPDADNPDDP